MSTHLRVPSTLLAALFLVLLPAGAAHADPTDPPEPPGTAAELLDPLTGVTTSGSAETSGSQSSASSATATRTPADAGRLPGLDLPGAGTTTNGSATTSTPTAAGSTAPGSTTGAGATNPATCIQGVVERLTAGLRTALGTGGDALMEEIGTPPTDPAALTAFLTGLPGALQAAGEQLSTQGEALLTTAAADLQACLPTPPTGGGAQPTGTSQPSTTHRPAPGTQTSAYADCDDARAHGAAPVYAGQPGFGPHLDSDSDGIGCEVETVLVAAPVAQAGRLAYTGVPVQPMIAWGAALVLSGGWLLLSGRRRA